MSEKIALPRFGMSRALRQLATRYAFFYEVIAGFSVPALITNIINDYAWQHGSFVDWLLISFSGYAAAAVVFIFGRVLFIWREKISTVAVLLTFIVAGLARGAVIYSLGGWLGQVSPNEFIYRTVGSTVFTLSMLGLITVLVSNGSRSAQKLDELEHQILLLQDSLFTLREQLAAQKAELLGRVKALVNPMLQGLIQKVSSSRASGSVVEAVASLKDAVDQDLRPLSLSVSAEAQPFKLADMSRAKSKFRLFTRVDQPIEVASLIVPTWMTLLLVLMGTPTATHIFGEQGLIQVMTAAAVVFLGLSLAEYLLRDRWFKQEAAFAIVMVTCAVLGLICDVVLTISPANTVDYRPGRVAAFVVVLGLAFFIGQLYQFQRELATRRLTQINESLEKLTANARRELWVYRRKVATVLHGPVQARLYASAIRLSQSKRITKPLIDRVSRELSEALAELDFEQRSTESIRQVMRQIIDVWSGQCEIFTAIDKEVYRLTKTNADFSDALIEVIRESISNAIKHSHATEIEVRASLVADLVKLVVISNGDTPNPKTARGFGSRLYDDLTYGWSLSSTVDGRTIFSAELVAD
ncbi:MAG: hypothetical protein RLZZ164_291 [Actinomycetota bacterium]|jgi:signal transduction histidine kinase